MSISHAKPFSRLRFMLLAALAAVGMAIATFGAAEAQAHGTCQATANPPSKTAFGNIRSDGTFSCTDSHRFLTLTVQIEKLKGGVWKPVGDPGTAKGTGQGPITAAAVIPCTDTDNYRAVAQGFTGREIDTATHLSKNTSSQSSVTCTASDLSNAGALLELATWRLGNA
jgi:hypothetical protein